METNQILSKILEKIEGMGSKIETMDSRLVALEAGQGKTNERLNKVQEDIEVIKEDTTSTRTSVNTLLDWAEEAQIEVRIPLYKKAE